MNNRSQHIKSNSADVLATDIFWTYQTPTPWAGEAMEWFWRSV